LEAVKNSRKAFDRQKKLLGLLGHIMGFIEWISYGLNFGGTGADVERGLALRMNHGTQCSADDFLNKVIGIKQSGINLKS
jgi:hypothetical protein